MIERLIDEEKKNLRSKLSMVIGEYDLLQGKLSVVMDQLEKLKKEQEDIIVSPRPKKNQFSFLKRVFLNAYNKEYERIVKDNKDKIEQITKLESEMEKLKLEINTVTDQKNAIDLEKANEDADVEITVEYLLNKHPELASNVEFMQEAIEISPSNIVFDKTNDSKIYKGILIYLKSKLSPKLWEGYDEPYPMEMYNCYLKNFDNAINEIDSPSGVEKGRYKIPIKYLFESIRMSFDKRSMSPINPPVEQEDLLKHYIHNVYFKIYTYFEYNGVISQEYGSIMSKIWDNPDMLTGVHGVERNVGTQINNNNTINSIMENGIMATNAMGELSQEKSNPQILATTYLQEYTDLDFLHFITYSYANSYGFVIFQIPKEGVGKTASIPIWGIDEDTDNRIGKAYLKPEYLLGYVINNRRIDPKDYTFIRKAAKCKTYKYSLMDTTYANKGETIYSEEQYKKQI